jgi:glycosyltransferase involved in cell wall biosynthesis
MPFLSLATFGSFVLPLANSIAERVDELHITYLEGKPWQDPKRCFSYHKIYQPYGFLRSKMAGFFMARGKLYSQVKDINVDVVLTLSEVWMQEFSRYCSRRMGIPYVVRLRGNHRRVREAFKVNALKKRFLNYLETRSLKDANLVIPNSSDLIKRAEEWGVKKEKITSPLVNGVDTGMFKPMKVERSNEFTIAYAGRISPEKGITRLLRTAERLTDVHILIAGANQMSLSFPRNVEYLGPLPFSEMPKFYNKADVVVLSSFTEGFPKAILEAYACGKPVLVTSEACPEELELFGSVADIDEFELEIKALKRSDLNAVGREARFYVEKHFT